MCAPTRSSIASWSRRPSSMPSVFDWLRRARKPAARAPEANGDLFDEVFQRKLEALAIAFPAAMLVGMGVEYLQKAGFARSLDVGDVWPVMFLLYVPALLFAHWRYR